jgi:hypothetical protein
LGFALVFIEVQLQINAAMKGFQAAMKPRSAGTGRRASVGRLAILGKKEFHR